MQCLHRVSYLVFSPEISGKILDLFYGKDFPHPVDGIYPCKRTLNVRTFNVVKGSRVQRELVAKHSSVNPEAWNASATCRECTAIQYSTIQYSTMYNTVE